MIVLATLARQKAYLAPKKHFLCNQIPSSHIQCFQLSSIRSWPSDQKGTERTFRIGVCGGSLHKHGPHSHGSVNCDVCRCSCTSCVALGGGGGGGVAERKPLPCCWVMSWFYIGIKHKIGAIAESRESALPLTRSLHCLGLTSEQHPSAAALCIRYLAGLQFVDLLRLASPKYICCMYSL